jgi:hypothetical protein
MLIFGWHIVIGCGRGALRIKNSDAPISQAIKCLGAGDFVNEVSINKHGIRITVSTPDNMTIPDLFKNCLWFRFVHNNR